MKMKDSTIHKHVKFVAILILSLVINQSLAQYEISKYTINSGGAKITGGNYEMNASIGQVDASITMSSGVYSLSGGFWQQNNDLIFKNGFE